MGAPDADVTWLRCRQRVCQPRADGVRREHENTIVVARQRPTVGRLGLQFNLGRFSLIDMTQLPGGCDAKCESANNLAETLALGTREAFLADRISVNWNTGKISVIPATTMEETVAGGLMAVAFSEAFAAYWGVSLFGSLLGELLLV